MTTNSSTARFRDATMLDECRIQDRLRPAERNTLNMADLTFDALSKPRKSPAPRYGIQAGRCVTIDGTPAFTLMRTPIPDGDGNGTHKLSPVELDCLAREIVALLNEPA